MALIILPSLANQKGRFGKSGLVGLHEEQIRGTKTFSPYFLMTTNPHLTSRYPPNIIQIGITMIWVSNPSNSWWSTPLIGKKNLKLKQVLRLNWVDFLIELTHWPLFWHKKDIWHFPAKTNQDGSAACSRIRLKWIRFIFEFRIKERRIHPK